MTHVKKNVVMAITGRAAAHTRAIFQPLMKAITNPPIVMQKVIINVGTFSPIAPCTANVSEATFVANVLGFIVSNHPISCYNSAWK